MPITYREDKNGYLVYENTKTGDKAYVWAGDVGEIGFICQEWHGGQGSACYRMMSGDYSYKNLDETLSELQEALEDSEDVSADDYVDLASAIETLEGAVKRIAKIAEDD